MGRNRQPVAVLVASGSRHYTKAELEERAAKEVHPPVAQEIEPPTYLRGSLAGKYRSIAKVLIQLGIFSDLDKDTLARYLLAESNYLRVTNKMTSALNAGNYTDACRLSAMQDRFYRQCRSSAADLGLTISSRCGLNLPIDPEPDCEEADLFGS